MILVPASAATIAPSYGYGGGVNCNDVENNPVNRAVLSVVAETGDMDMCYSAWTPLELHYNAPTSWRRTVGTLTATVGTLTVGSARLVLDRCYDGDDARLVSWTSGYSVTTEIWRSVLTALARGDTDMVDLFFQRYMLKDAVVDIAKRITEAGAGARVRLPEMVANTPLPADLWLLTKALRVTADWIRGLDTDLEDAAELLEEAAVLLRAPAVMPAPVATADQRLQRSIAEEEEEEEDQQMEQQMEQEQMEHEQMEQMEQQQQQQHQHQHQHQNHDHQHHHHQQQPPPPPQETGRRAQETGRRAQLRAPPEMPPRGPAAAHTRKRSRPSNK
jgi:hypothetical protein